MKDEKSPGRSLRGNVDRNTVINESGVYALVVPYVGTWIEIICILLKQLTVSGRSLRGNVDRNLANDVYYLDKRSRSLRGNVDRNLKESNTEASEDQVVPYVGTWIEI